MSDLPESLVTVVDVGPVPPSEITTLGRIQT